jgi:hypothetical protein
MHPDNSGQQGERCRICGMALVPAPTLFDAFGLDINFPRSGLVPGRATPITLRVRDPHTHAIVRRLQEVHTKLFHLFVVGDDLEHFEHIHPVLRRNGALGTTIIVPKAGIYRLLGDFFPTSAPPQLVQRMVVTNGYHGRLSAAAAALTIDTAPKARQGTHITLTMPEAVAGREQLVTFDVTDESTGRVVSDLQQYLGAWGHLVVVSADRAVAFHSHPVDAVSSAGGPTVVFQLLFPTAGTYRMWAQFQRHDQVLTVPFTIVARPAQR